MKATAIKIARALLWLIYAWVVVTVVLLLLLFILRLFGANPTAGFVEWVYRSTERAMAPFRGIFEPLTLSDASVLDTSVVFAMIVYTFVGLGLQVALDWITRLLRAEEEHEREANLLEAHLAATGPRQVVHLADTSGMSVTAVLAPAGDGTSIELTAAGLEPATWYCAWVEGADGSRVSTAAFETTPSGTASVRCPARAHLASSRRFGLTRLPRAGDMTGSDVVASRLA